MRCLFPFALLVSSSMFAADHRAVIDELLLWPAPAPIYEAATPRQNSENGPPDDAPLPELVAWWSNHNGAVPSAAVRERLIGAIEHQPQSVVSILGLFPARADVCEGIKRLRASENTDQWMLRNCASHRDALATIAAQAADAEKGGYVEKREELEALARVEWNRAEPILRLLAGSPQPRSRALAMALLYEHTPTESQRASLQSIAIDSTAPAFARDLAFEALAHSDWEGRDEWLLDRMSDRTLLALRDGHTIYAPYNEIVRVDPAKWIPIMTSLLGHSDGAVRSIAANALGQFHLKQARVDAIRPLIPWISDPAWVENAGMTRLRIIQSVADLGLREAIPHLARVVANDADEANRAYAARALADFPDHSANDAMRAAADTMKSGHNREIVIGALIATGGLTAEDLAGGVEAFLDFKGNEFELSYSRTSVATPLLVGLVVTRRARDRDDVAALLVTRAAQLAAAKPELARKLIELVETWNTPTADALLLGRIEQQRADAHTISTALLKREALRTSAAEALRRLSASDGMRGGIAAVLVGDPMHEQRILAGKDTEAQRALLAAARLVREPLPIDAVAALFGRLPALDVAAEAWLVAEDSSAARAIVQKRHPGEILILGSRLAWDPGHHTYAAFAEWEKDLLRRFRASNEDEWIVLAYGGTWSAMTPVVEIRIRDDKATLSFETESGPRTVPLSRNTLGALGLFLVSTRFDDLGSFDTGTMDGVQYEYVHLTRSSGRRVFMNNPDTVSPHGQLVTRLMEMVERAIPNAVR